MTLSAEDRRKVISIARRLAGPGSGSGAQTLRERSAEYGPADVRQFLGSVPFVVVGGLATRLYMPERMTLDVDVLISLSSLAEAERALEQSGCKRLGPLTIGGSTWRLPGGTNLDLIALDAPWVQAALDHAVQGPANLPYVELPYLVLMKLASGRLQDLADISRMLGGADQAVREQTRKLVALHRESDGEDLDSLISLGEQEYSDQGNPSQP